MKITGNESIYDPKAFTVKTYIAMNNLGAFIHGGNHSDPDEMVELSLMLADKLIESINKSGDGTKEDIHG